MEEHHQIKDYDSDSFFSMHDYNNDGFLDEKELRIIFQGGFDEHKENADTSAMEDSLREMMTYVLTEVDTDKDGRISRAEFKRHEDGEGPAVEPDSSAQHVPEPEIKQEDEVHKQGIHVEQPNAIPNKYRV
eukprot:Colp12_sorted_trinity150504_noHs@6707